MSSSIAAEIEHNRLFILAHYFSVL